MPMAFRLGRRLPAGVRRLVKRGFGWSVSREPAVRWEPGALRSVVEIFREDSLQLLSYCGKSLDIWNLDALGMMPARSGARA